MKYHCAKCGALQLGDVGYYGGPAKENVCEKCWYYMRWPTDEEYAEIRRKAEVAVDEAWECNR